MIRIFLIAVLFLIPQQEPNLYNKQGKPSSEGIIKFIDENKERLLIEYEYKSKFDIIYEVRIYTENLSYYDNDALGIYYIPDEIVITDQEKFIEYEFKNLSKYKQKNAIYNDHTVKAIIFHELTHIYFYQLVMTLNKNGHYVHPGYGAISMFRTSELYFGADFIEEGICEYVVYYLKETPSLLLKDFKIPKTKIELLDSSKLSNNKYLYSSYFLKNFLDTCGLEKGIKILVDNPPPTYEEILNPSVFFSRLNKE